MEYIYCIRKDTIRIQTLNDFIQWTAQFSDGQYLFRGVSTENYRIEASASRRLQDADRNNPSKLLKINKDLIEKARSLGHDRKDSQQLSDLEILAELQHFGAATCLIDFSRNALVALWFACQQGSKGEANGKVVAIRNDDTVRIKTVIPELIKNEISYFLTPDNNGKYPIYQWHPKLQNHRIIAQQSVFLICGAQIEVEAECVILSHYKQDILLSLDKTSSITEANVYPDFDGFARLHAHNKPFKEPDTQEYLQRGIEAQQNGNLDDAIEYFTEVIQIEPEDIQTVYAARFNRGLIYTEKKETDNAIEDLNIVIQLNPTANAYNTRGYAYRVKGDNISAVEDYDKAIEIDSKNLLYYNNRILALLQLHRWDKAESDIITAKNMGTDIITLFQNSYTSVPDFEKKFDVEMPIDLADMLTPP